MPVEWTDKQLEAITHSGENILVSAAAGSGKTAVLVERIIRIITNKENPISIDRLLVLTYTEAAASEMKRKIASAINQKLEETPNDDRLREQAMKVGSACISTIHSFCSRIISNNAHLTDLPSDFSLINETENKLLQQQALDDIMESYYKHIDTNYGFRSLVTGWSDIKNDDSLRETIIRMHNVSRSFPNPSKWLINIYKSGYASVERNKTLKNSPWETLLSDTLYSLGEKISNALGEILRISEENIPPDHPMYAYYFEMKSDFCTAFSEIDKFSDDALEKLDNLFRTFKIKRSAVKKGIEDIEPRLTYMRDEFVKKSLKEGLSLLDALSDENIRRLSNCAPAVKTLCRIVRLCEKTHQKYKRERSAIDFNDLEHGLYNLLCDKNGKETPLCKKLREYYHEIAIDEFQDTNNLQFNIFKLLSKPQGNLFMVGDVKQSIYKFRNADPEIFLQLSKKYKNGDGGHLICLSQNFRSRCEVIESVNDIFRSVMSEKCGDVEYSDDEALKLGANYPNSNGCETEIMITDTTLTPSKDDEISDFENDSLSREARAVADRIYKMVRIEHFQVFDKERGEMRDIKFGDIAILCRSTNPDRSILETELLRLGINSVSDSGQHYLTSLEVSTLLAFLQIIDNPIQDIPLIAVMRSGMFGFTAEELAKIRTYSKGHFYDAVTSAASKDRKTADFLAVLSDLRDCSKYMGVDEIVRKICNDLHYFAIIGAMPGGEQRKANIKLFLNICSDYEQGAFNGLFNFIRYTEMLKDAGDDLIPAKDNSDNDNSVKIMTIHKSKGLEFPVVILFHSNKSFNREDLKRNIIWHEKSGLGLDYVDTEQRVRYPLPTRSIIKKSVISSSLAEEMRLLYVAMTRAQEKLIISASVTSRFNNWKKCEFNPNGYVDTFFPPVMNSMRDWIFSALLNHPSAALLRHMADRDDIIAATDKVSSFNVYLANNMQSTSPENTTCEVTKENDNTENFDPSDVLDYTYPHAILSELPIKLSVSELKRRKMPEEDFSASYLNIPTRLASSADDFNASERGTITHFVIQHIDIYKTDRREDIEEQVENMMKSSMINQFQKDIVDIDSIYGFFSSELGQRLKKSKNVEREYDFYMQISPSELDECLTDDTADDIILQGIADCFFREDDGIVLIDYKTDAVTTSTVVNRAELYRLQIEHYARGISAIFDVPVKEKYLYFLNCGSAIKIQ